MNWEGAGKDWTGMREEGTMSLAVTASVRRYPCTYLSNGQIIVVWRLKRGVVGKGPR